MALLNAAKYLDDGLSCDYSPKPDPEWSIEMEAKVYRRLAQTVAEIGPIGTWEKGDKVEIPSRAPGTMDRNDPGSPSFHGVVSRVDEDGVAIATTARLA